MYIYRSTDSLDAKDTGCFVAFFGSAYGFVPQKEYSAKTLTPEEAAALSSLGKTVRCRVLEKGRQPSLKLTFLLNPPKQSLETKLRQLEKSKRGKALLLPERIQMFTDVSTLRDVKVGSTIKVKVESITLLQLNVIIGLHVKGRIHITEIVDEPTLVNPLSNFEVRNGYVNLTTDFTRLDSFWMQKFCQLLKFRATAYFPFHTRILSNSVLLICP